MDVAMPHGKPGEGAAALEHVRATAGNRAGQRSGAVSHGLEIVFEHGGFRWACSCGRRGASALGTRKAAEREHFYHQKRQGVTKD